MRLFQALLNPRSPQDGEAFAAAGFEQLAQLVYLERPTTLPLESETAACSAEPKGIWAVYDFIDT